VKARDGSTAMTMASQNGHSETVRILEEAGGKK